MQLTKLPYLLRYMWFSDYNYFANTKISKVEQNTKY